MTPASGNVLRSARSAAHTRSRTGLARMSFTVEVEGLPRLQKLFEAIRELKSVLAVHRA